MPFVKGQSGNPAGKPKGAKNRETLLREERRAIFENRISQRWEEIIDELPVTYIADQYLGKAPDKLDVTSKDEQVGNVDLDALAAVMATKLRNKQLDDGPSETTGS